MRHQFLIKLTDGEGGKNAPSLTSVTDILKRWNLGQLYQKKIKKI